jgi:hypothetical protein
MSPLDGSRSKPGAGSGTRTTHSAKGRLVEQQVAAGALQGVLVDADTHGGVALRVHVHQQDAALQRREGGGEVDGVVVLPTPPFWFAMAMMRAMGILRVAATEAADGVGQYFGAGSAAAMCAERRP